MICPECKGKKEKAAFVMGKFGCGLQIVACFTCDGLGVVPDEYPEWKRLGTEFRNKRIHRDESLGDCARRLGVSIITLSNMERGKLKQLPYTS